MLSLFVGSFRSLEGFLGELSFLSGNDVILTQLLHTFEACLCGLQ